MLLLTLYAQSEAGGCCQWGSKALPSKSSKNTGWARAAAGQSAKAAISAVLWPSILFLLRAANDTRHAPPRPSARCCVTITRLGRSATKLGQISRGQGPTTLRPVNIRTAAFSLVVALA